MRGGDIMSNKYYLRQICRNIVMAQGASEGGKAITAVVETMKKDHCLGYGQKEHYIISAIKMIDSAPINGIFYYVEKTPDQNGFSSILVTFDISVDNKRYQISFHNPYERTSKFLRHKIGSGRKTHWVGNHSKSALNSSDAAIELVKYFGF